MITTKSYLLFYNDLLLYCYVNFIFVYIETKLYLSFAQNTVNKLLKLTGRYGAEKTPYSDTFHAVNFIFVV